MRARRRSAGSRRPPTSERAGSIVARPCRMRSGLTLGEVADSRRNNLRVIRLLAAVTVIVAHSLGMLHVGPPRDVSLLEIVFGNGSAIAVNVFFIASGFLVARSLIEREDLLGYVAARALRVYPALIMLSFLTAFILGPIITVLPLGEYFTSKMTYGYAVRNSIMIWPGFFRYELPGVFTAMQHQAGRTVNGSLWTLPWELWMYVSLPLAWKLRLLSRICAILVAVIMAVYAWNAPLGLVTHTFPTIAVRLIAFFYVGVALFRYRERVPLSVGALAMATIAFAVTWLIAGAPILLPAWLGYAVVFAAYYPRLVIDRWCEGPDYSYGLYIYAYPIQQTLILLAGMRSVGPHVLASLALTLPLAILSWHLVEEPALRLKRRLTELRRVLAGLRLPGSRQTGESGTA